MKTLKKVPLELIEVDYIPSEMEFGKFYYSKEFDFSNHLCVCGCGHKVPIPIKKGQWKIVNKIPLSVTPSLQQTFECKTHYIISNGVANIV